MNPPYGREIGKWIKKAYEEYEKGAIVVCLIPARSGSKGIKYKNLAKLKGKPLLYWTIQIAKKIKYFDKIVVSTDSKKFQNYAIKNKVCAPFLRPKIISNSKLLLVLLEKLMIHQHV